MTARPTDGLSGPGAVHNDIGGTVHGHVVQVGHVEEVNAAQVVVVPRRPAVRWPVRVGVVPLLADCFQDREALRRFERSTADGTPAAGTWVLAGMGGVGKTQLAASFAERLLADGEVELLLWVTAGSRDSIIAAYAATSAEVIGSDHIGPEHDANRMPAWLATTGRRWLVVLDDLVNPADLRGLWPPNRPTGRVVITTRRRDASLSRRDRRLVEVGVFTPEESASYFADKLVDHDRLATGAAELAADLGHLPIALAQAAAYLVDRGLTARQYRRRLAARGKTLAQVLPGADELPDDHRNTVAATWALSVELLDRLPPPHIAARLMELASVLDANGVPARVFTSMAVSTWLRDELGHPADADDVTDALHSLQRFSLATVKLDEPDRAVKVHALVQRATREGTPGHRVRQAARAAAEALLEIWPEVEHYSEFTAALRSNVMALHAAEGDHLWEHETRKVLFRAGTSLQRAGMFTQGIDYFDAMAATASRLLGADHPDTLTARSHLADIRGDAGNPLAAIEQLRDLVVDRRRVLGADHLDTLSARGDVAYWLGNLGQYAAAAVEQERVLADQSRVLGSDHPITMTTRKRLAKMRTKAGSPALAVAELERLLIDRLRVSGPDHSETLMTRNLLAACVAAAGDTAGAATRLAELLPDLVRVMGADHPKTLAVRNDLAYWSGTAGDPVGAAARFEQVVADKARVLGWDHPSTIYTRSNLADWTGRAGDPARAVAQLERLLEDQRRVLAPEHPYTARVRGLLAHWRSRTGR